VVFEVKKYFAARIDQVSNNLRAFCREELFAHFEGVDGLSQQRDDTARFSRRGDIQGNYETVACVTHGLSGPYFQSA
jgi:hypothetical protein